MATSPSRLAAARANGKKSPGPVTPEGNARSGLLARTVCLRSENPAEFTRLHQALIAEFAPVTFTEQLIVEEMAVARWRLRRLTALRDALHANKNCKTNPIPNTNTPRGMTLNFLTGPREPRSRLAARIQRPEPAC